MKEKSYNIVSIFFALITSFAIEGMIKSDDNYHVLSNSIFSVIVFFGALALFVKVLQIRDRRLYRISCIVGSLFSFFLVCGKNILLNNTTNLDSLWTWIYIITGIPFMAGCVALVIYLLPKINGIFRMEKCEAWFEKNITPKKTFLLSWIVTFLAWFPGLLAAYPGVYAYDCVYQMGYYLSGNINLHHPLVHTYLLGFFVEDLGTLLGSKEAGFFCYSIFQMICMAGMLSMICYYMAKKKCAVILRIAVLSVIALLPVNAIMSFSGTKDVLFSGFFCLMVYFLMQIADDEKYLSKKKSWIMTLAAIFGMMIFRNQGIYVVILGMLCGFVLLKKQRKRVLLLLTASILLFGLYSGPVTQLLNGVKSSSRANEMLSVPIMQLSRSISYNVDELTEEEIELIKEYIPNCENYKEGNYIGISDGYKRTFNASKFNENPMEFISLWVKVGIKCPMSYIDAFARLSIGLWYPDMNYRDQEAWHPYWEYRNSTRLDDSWIILERKTPDVLQWLDDFYTKLTYDNTYQKVPIVSMIFSSGFSVWILLLYIAWCIYKKQYKLLFPAAFLVGYWLTSLVGPVVLYRYVYPIMVSIPILIAKAITQNEANVE